MHQTHEVEFRKAALHPVRAGIIRQMLSRTVSRQIRPAICASDLVRPLSESLGNLDHHLKVLRERGLVCQVAPLEKASKGKPRRYRLEAWAEELFLKFDKQLEGLPVAERDERIVQLCRALDHPLRRRILEELLKFEAIPFEERESGETVGRSPTKLVELVNDSLANTSGQLRELSKIGIVEESGNRPVRGALKHFYLIEEWAREPVRNLVA